MSFGVGYQLDCDVVNARILGERSIRELWQLLVVPARKIRPDLANVLLYDVGVVEQPVTGWTYVDSALRRISETVVYFAQYLSRVIESIEKRTRPSLLARWKKPVFTRDVARMSRETIRAEHLAADRANELSVRALVAKAQ
jgi:hypothetical protein